MKLANLLLLLILPFCAAAAPIVAEPVPTHLEAMAAYGLGDFATARRGLAPLAEKGDRDALWRLGVLHANGQGGPKDFATAFRMFKAAAAAGHLRSYYDLGLMYQLGEGRLVDAEQAMDWYERGTAAGCGECARMLGLESLDGSRVSDANDAERWLRRATELGDPHGMVLLSRLLMGLDGEPATDEALKWLREAEDRGWHPAKQRRALLLWSSHRRPQDAVDGVAELKGLVKQKQPVFDDLVRGVALFNLTRSAALGWGMRQDWSAALSYAAEFDGIVKGHQDDEDFIHLRNVYPVFEAVRSLIDALGDLEKHGKDMSCESAQAIINAARLRLLSVSYLDPGKKSLRQVDYATYRCHKLPANRTDPASEDYERSQWSLGLDQLRAEWLLPSAAIDGIGFRFIGIGPE